MAVITDSLFLDILLALPPTLYLVYWFLTGNNDYWTKKGVTHCEGFFIDMILGRKSQVDFLIEKYNELSGKRFGGLVFLRKPTLFIRDPELVHRILVKDFSHFEDRHNQPSDEKDQFQTSLFGLRGKVWRDLRHKLTPTFTTGKLRGMFEQISKCGENMMEKIEEVAKTNSDVESKSFVFEFTLDVISSCAFGVQFKPNSPEFNEFKSYVTNMFVFSPVQILRLMTVLLAPKLAIRLGIQQFNSKSSKYFTNLTKATMRSRKENNVKRNDYFQLLLDLKEQEESGKDMGLSASDATEDDKVIDQMQYTEQDGQSLSSNVKLMTDNVICANTSIFLVAGSESTAGTISFSLMEIALHPDVQKHLQEEVDEALLQYGGWTYDTIKHMTYLDQVIQETQRMYPLLPGLQRVCVKPYRIPDSNIVIEEGTMISIPTCALHRDPQHYHNPEVFNPDRFEGNNFKPNPYFLPFGDGPRICIAMRFAVMEVKACIARIMSQYSVKMSPKTQLPLKFNKRAVFPTAEGGVWLSFEKRDLPSKGNCRT